MIAGLPVAVGLGWRPETAWLIDSRGITFSEVIAENIDPRRVPPALAAAIERGAAVVTHGVSLSLGSTEAPDRAQVRRLAAVARALKSPLVSEHVAFARAGELRASHFLPVPHTRAQLALMVDHVRRVADALPVPLALENVAAPLVWPGAELAEADFLAELVARTGTYLLLDVANLVANLTNHGGELASYLDRLPLDRVAYMHVAGGARVAEMWRDTHAHAVAPATLDALATVLARTGARPVLLERDHAFGSRAELDGELDDLERVLSAAPRTGSPRTIAPAPARYDVSPAARSQLSTSHRALLSHLLDRQAPAPAGFAPQHLAEAREILDGKRNRRNGLNGPTISV